MTQISARQWFSSCALQVASIVFVLIIVGVALNSPKFLAATNPHFKSGNVRDDTAAKAPSTPNAVQRTKGTIAKGEESTEESASADESATTWEDSESSEEATDEEVTATPPKKLNEWRLRVAIINSGEFRNFNDNFQTFVDSFLAPMHEYADVDMYLCCEISPPPGSEADRGLKSLLERGLLKNLFNLQQHAISQFHRMEICYDWAKKTAGEFYKVPQDLSRYTHIVRTRPDFHYVPPVLDLRQVDSSKLNIRIRGMRFQPPAWKDVAMNDAHMSWLYDNPHKCWDPPCPADCLQQPFCVVVDDACAVMNSTIAESYFRFHSKGEVPVTDENRPCDFAGGWPEWTFTRYQLYHLGGYKTLMGDAAGAMIWPLPMNVRLRDPKHAGWCGSVRCCLTACPDPTPKICDRIHPW